VNSFSQHKEMATTYNGLSRRRGRTSKGLSIIALTTTAMLRIGDVSSMLHPSPTAPHCIVAYVQRLHHVSLAYERNRRSMVLMMSDSDELSSSSTASATNPPSERSQRKAAQRARKQSNQGQVNINKLTSQHPDAILKRKLQKDPRQSSGAGPTRRKHNFAQRVNFLHESEKPNDDFDADLDGLRSNQLTNTNIHPVENPYDHTNNHPMVHPLHSTKVEKLDTLSTTADDVVKAIKRAQNYHDIHDIREIAHFLLEEVGELLNVI
jgi:hypothetical protein